MAACLLFSLPALALAPSVSDRGLGTSPFRPAYRAVSSSRAHPVALGPTGNVYDEWFEERRSRNRVSSTETQEQQAQALQPLPVDVASVSQVLTEFVESRYAWDTFNYANIQCVTDYGTLEGMFQRVQVKEDGTIVLKMKPAFSSMEGLLDRVTTYLRARMPQVAQVHAVHRDGFDIH
jgi:hypothetical protein